MKAGYPGVAPAPTDAARLIWVRLLALVALLGLAVAVFVHVHAWIAPEPDVWLLSHIALPIATAVAGSIYLIALDLCGFPRVRSAWKTALSGCPEWIRPVLHLLIAVTAVSFLIGFNRMFLVAQAAGEPHLLRMGSCF